MNGCVTFVDDARDTFSLTPSQYVTGATQHETIPVRAIINRNAPFLSTTLPIPRINSLVGFTAKLTSLETNSESGTGPALCAEVSVETISHLTADDNSPMSSQDEDSVALHTRVQKYTAQSVIEHGEDGSSQNQPLSGNSKGKRKLTLTFDSGGSGKAERVDKKRR